MKKARSKAAGSARAATKLARAGAASPRAARAGSISGQAAHPACAATRRTKFAPTAAASRGSASEPTASARASAGGQAADRGVRAALLAWFEAHRRDLPWRRTKDPYAIWLSEVMLQQTQVATVVPYYTRFLARFPTAKALAGAELPEVLSLWSGLGYYSRARNLHRAAQLIARDGMPRTAQALRELPGFGRYTAAAVASIALGEPVAVLDGNVARVLARLRGIEAPLDAPQLREGLWAEAEALLDPRRPGDFNEAMMELGALVCTPAAPRCDTCPLHTRCEARRRGLVDRIPVPRVRRAPTRLALACAAVVRRDGALLLARRPERGLFGGLWELPSTELVRGVRPADALARALGVAPREPDPFATVRRSLTHRELTLRLVRCATPRGALPGYLEQRWVRPEELGALGMSTAMARAVAKVVEPERRRGRSAPTDSG